MSQIVYKKDASEILADVSFEEGFHFNLKTGEYVGLTATSLADFADKLETVDVESILYHYPRGDFQYWIGGTLGDAELADRLCFIEPGLSGEQTRKELLKIIRARVNELEGPWESRSDIDEL